MSFRISPIPVVALLPILCGFVVGNGVTIGSGVFLGPTQGSPQAALQAPDISALAVATPTDAHRVCQDTNSDGVCDGFKYRVRSPMDTSSWTVSAAGASPTMADLNTEVSSDPGCEIVEFSGQVTVGNSQAVAINNRDCIGFRGPSPSNKATVHIADYAQPPTLCGADHKSYFYACGTSGTNRSWTSGYDKGTTVIGTTNVSDFALYDGAAPWGDGMYVVVHSNADHNSCAVRFPRQPGSPPNTGTVRNGNDAIHRVVGIVDSDGAGAGTAGTLTIDPPLWFDYDEHDPDCAGYEVRPAKVPVVFFENIKFEFNDGDLDCNQTSGSVAGCFFARWSFLDYRYAQGWVKDVEFYHGSTDFITLRYGVDVTMMNIEAHNPTSNYWQVNFQATYIRFGEGTSNSALLNAYIHDIEQPIQFREGGRGNVVAHVFQENIRRSGIHWHGLWAGPNHVESSVIQHMALDRQWGPNGPWSNTYRNRIITAGLGGGATRHHDGTGGQQVGPPPANPTVSQGTGDYWTHIGDVAEDFNGANQAPYTFFDDHNTPGAHGEYLWPTNSAAFGSCPTCTFSNLASVSATQPTGWDQVDAPPSLFCWEDLDNPGTCRAQQHPDYWCQEGADYYDVSNSVGAFSPTQQQLPAERVLKLGLPCTPCGADGAGC